MSSEPTPPQQGDRHLADELSSGAQEATVTERNVQQPKGRSSARKKPQSDGVHPKHAAARHGPKSQAVDLNSSRDNRRDQRTAMFDSPVTPQPPGLLSQELNSTTSRELPISDYFNMPGSSQGSENGGGHSPSPVPGESIPDKASESLIEGLSGNDSSFNARLNSMRLSPGDDGRSSNKMMHGVSPSSPSPNLIPRSSVHGNNQYAEYSPTPRSFGSIRQNNRHSSLNTYYGSSPMYHHSSGSHFYSAPTEMDFRSFAHGQMPPTSHGTYSFCAFDTLPNLSKPSKMSAGNVLLVGRDDWLEIVSLTHERTHVLGKLENLGGRVVGARFLTWSSSMHDPFASSRPHIAVIIHGQVPNHENGDPNDFADNMSNISSTNQGVPHVQTSVEVFSLKTQSHVATFFSTQAVPCPYPEGLPGLPNAAPPGPIGNLRLHASGNYLVVTSGTSGEIFVYTALKSNDAGIYQCIGKMWSMIQPQLDQDFSRRHSTNSGLSADKMDDHNFQPDGSQHHSHVETPIFSISGRWIAVVPPASPSMMSLHGTIPSQLTSKHRRQSVVESIESFSPSMRPSVSCLVDEGGGESFFNKFARGLTQEVFKGAKWIGDQGMQTWNYYWNPKDKEKEQFLAHPPQQPNVTLPRVYLPPTHGHDAQSHDEPDTISIFDLKRLEEGLELGRSSYPPTPVATFQPPNGCSYLSLSPSGLMLFASSKKGDLHHVWDIMQMKHRTAKSFHIDDLASTNNVANVPAPLVRLVSRYPRLTTSSVVDVVWAAPWGERIAIVTKKGTVHIHDIPKAAFHWPPPRRFVPNGIVREDTFQSLEDSSKTTSFSSAIKKFNDRAQPIFSAMRNRAPSVGNAITGATRAGALGSAAAGGKVVAAGLTRSVGAATETMNTFRRAGEARLHVSTANGAAPARVAWFGKKPNPLLGVVSDRYFKAYTIHKSLPSKKNKSYSVIGDKTTEIRLPAAISPIGSNEAQPPILPPNESENVSGFWSAPHSSSAMRGFSHDKTLPLSQAVLDSNSPYQPFHTDRRVSLSVYAHIPEQSPEASSDNGEWVFGRNDISTVKLNIHPAYDSYDEEPEEAVDDTQSGGTYNPDLNGSSEQLNDRPGLAHHARNSSDMENLISVGNAGNTSLDHVVITTRRKKKRPAQGAGSAPEPADDDGFFEDDCEVLDFADDRV